jgi:NAD(P)-dependent dehydrogenase (short-subunit alcohol dehydrogenase family)
MKLLENKVAIVTGGGSGIGKAVAEAFAREGAKVVVSDINDEGGNETVKSITGSGGTALFVKADSAKPEDHERLVKQAVEQYSGLHIAVNNAGIGGPLALTGEYPLDGWEKVIAINLSGVFYAMRYQLPAMQQTGEGSIINIASILGQAGTATSPAYVAAKHGVVGLTKSAALGYAKQNIRVNSVGPGYIHTPMVENSMDEGSLKYLVGLHPIGRLGKSEEVAELILWLASPKASFVTGAYYNVDGGYLAQ